MSHYFVNVTSNLQKGFSFDMGPYGRGMSEVNFNVKIQSNFQSQGFLRFSGSSGKED